MDKKSLILKLILVGFEFAFIGTLFFFRILNIGWIFIIFGILLVLWAFVQMGLVTMLILSTKFKPLEIFLYLIVHFFYLGGWLFQSDFGDIGGITWVIQKIYDNASLTAFLEHWGDTVFWSMTAGTALCYLVIAVILIMRLSRRLSSRKRNALTPS